MRGIIGEGDSVRYVCIFYVNIPIGSMYGIFTYMWLKCMVNVGKYSIHGSYGIYIYYSYCSYIYII